MLARHVGSLLRAFGDGTRLRIVNVLAQGDLTVGQLAALLQCPIPRLSRHLRYLQARGLLEWERRGNAVAYRLAKPVSGVLAGALAAVLSSLHEAQDVRRDNEQMAKMRRARVRQSNATR